MAGCISRVSLGAPTAGGRWPVTSGRWPVTSGRWPVAGADHRPPAT